ncbi:MAG: SUMF1/EgtB/PvdO family nonheme iron enzyme [Anaerolineales bacterium]|nr:SUMF1/EgtB/PvdO family nonheme iron enzyme [Anaerolineales bacterium]
MNKTQALENLLANKATKDEIEFLKGLLINGEISIGGDVSNSVIIKGDGNVVSISPEILDKLNGRALLGNFDRELNGDQILFGLKRLESELATRAPILLSQFQEQTRRLQPFIKTASKSLSEQALKERVVSIAEINRICNEALDISFNSLCLGNELPEYDLSSPFRGLESFRPEHSEFFFGRELLVEKLVQKIKDYPFLAILGDSGSGKSSLAMAGLIPALGLDYVIFRPGNEPLVTLEANLLSIKKGGVIIVDQFEELFTLTKHNKVQRDFISKLLEKTESNKVILTMRSDFLSEVAEHHNLNQEIQNHLENISTMTIEDLSRAMEKQAQAGGLRFEADLNHQMLEDVDGAPGAMPLLQHTLWELWNRRHGRWLSVNEYRAFGGVKQAITNTAESLYIKLNEIEQKQMRNIFLRLSNFDIRANKRHTGKRVFLEDLIPYNTNPDLTLRLLDKLINARLIIKSTNQKRIEVEIAHDALIYYWERLQIWLNEDVPSYNLQYQLHDRVHQWESSNYEFDGDLYSGLRLKLLEEWVKKNPGLLSSLEIKFLQASVKQKKMKLLSQASIFIVLITFLILTILSLRGELNGFIYQPIDMNNYWVLIPEGEFKMGLEDSHYNEVPEHSVYLESFEIGRYEITNQQFEQCVKAGYCLRTSDVKTPYYKKTHPVVNVSWYAAQDFCKWVGGRLPTEAEWEKAASWDYELNLKRKFPWGDNIDCSFANYYGKNKESDACVGDTTPVGSYKAGRSKYEVYDLTGNVWEWTSSLPYQYPYNPNDGREDINSPFIRVARGGSWLDSEFNGRLTTTYRLTFYPLNSSNNLGFRCARDIP